MEEIVEAAEWKHANGGKHVFFFKCLCLYLLCVSLPHYQWYFHFHICVFHSFFFKKKEKGFLIFPLFQIPAGAVSSSGRSISCREKREMEGKGFKDSLTNSPRITCFSHYASHPALCWKRSRFALLLRTLIFFLSISD